MKKLILIVSILLFVSFTLSAFTPHQDGTGNFTLQAYYKGQNQNNKSVSLTITDSSDAKIYHGGTTTVSFSNTEQDSFSFEPIFSWELKGEGFNSNCSISLKFTFKALMAYVDGYDTYYVPGHQFSMVDIAFSAGSGSSFSQSAASMSAFPATTGNYQYPEYNSNNIYRSVTYTGTMVPDNEGDWTASGDCNLNVTSYSKLAGIALNYKGDVKVEFTVQ